MEPRAPRHPPLPPGQIDAPHRIAELGDLALESGEAIHDFRQSYVTHGTLNADRSNVALICSAIATNHHRLDFLIGPGRALDPAHWFIVATDAIGNGLTTSPGNSARQPRMRFPRFTIRDMVSAQHRLLAEHLGIERIAVVVGASMGGMQALQWAVSYPEFMDAVVALTPMARTSPWAIAVNEVERLCLMADPVWTGNGFAAVPERGWRAWVGVQNVLTNRSPRGIAADFPNPRDVLGWLGERQRLWLDAGFDPHDFLYQSWAYDAHDVGTTPGFGGDTARALGSIRARTLILTPPLDLYNPAEAGIEAASAIPGARHMEIPSLQGHQAANSVKQADVDFMNRVIPGFLAEGRLRRDCA